MLVRLVGIFYPDRIPYIKGNICDLVLIRAIAAHDPELAATRDSVGDKDDLAAVWREAGVMIPFPIILG